MRRTTFVLILLAAGVLGCAPHYTSHEYGWYDARQPLTIDRGVVEALVPATITAPDTGTGAAAGSAMGMAAGSAVGNGSGTAMAMVGGAILGALAGSAIEHQAARRPAVEIDVRLEDGRLVAVVQEEDPAHRFYPGDEVEVLTAPDGTARVRHRPK